MIGAPVSSRKVVRPNDHLQLSVLAEQRLITGGGGHVGNDVLKVCIEPA